MNKLIAEEMRYNREDIHIEHQQLLQRLPTKQCAIYNEIILATSHESGVYFFYMVMVELLKH
jgi:hypothetical protein